VRRSSEVRPSSWSRTDGMELLWLYEDSVGNFCGFDPDPGSAGLWILHAMYEQQDPAAELVRTSGFDWDADPGPGWRRLHWNELSKRTGDPGT
jgi:hypothetical protein